MDIVYLLLAYLPLAGLLVFLFLYLRKKRHQDVQNV